jgi:hypothetical protein
MLRIHNGIESVGLTKSLLPRDAIGQPRERYPLPLISFGASALRASFGMGSSIGSMNQSGPIQSRCPGGPTSSVAVGRHTSPVKAERASSCVQRRSAHRIRGTTVVVGTGGAVRPFTLCLSAQGPRWTDPTIAPAFDGLKYSHLSQGHACRPLPAWVVIPGPRNVRFSRRLSPPVSAVPHSQEVTER